MTKPATSLFEMAAGNHELPTESDLREEDAPARERAALALCVESADTLCQRAKFLNAESKLSLAQRFALGMNEITKSFHVVVFANPKQEEATPDLFTKPNLEVDIS